ncbi:MAG: DUF3341 domain-containing protein [Candidatus Latescibacterota bacterium]
MSRRVFLAFFAAEQDVLAATAAVRQRGLTILDVYTPYAVHGLDRAMGLAPSRLPVVCFLLGLLGAAFKVWFEFWTTGVSWPLNVGGKPVNSLPAFVPVTFEVMVLCAGVSTVLAFLFVARLGPGKKARVPHVSVTNDRFVLVIEEGDAAFDAEAVGALLRRYHAVQTEERVIGGQA